MNFPKMRLDKVCRITMGQAPSGDSYNFDGNGLALIAGAGDFGKETPEPKKFTTAAGKKSEKGEIILCIRATIGDLNWSDKEYCLGRGVAGLFGHKDKLDQKYLWHWLKNIASLLKSKGKGATFLQVTKEDICSLEITLPPLSEQRRIASILDKAEELRQKRQQAIEKLDQLLQATFIDMFGDPVNNPKGWNKVRFEEVVEFLTGFAFKSADFKESGIKLCRGINVLPNTLDWDDTAYWDIVDVEKYSRFKIQRNDILVAMDRPWISTGFKIALVQRNDPNMLLVQRVARLRVKEDFGANFLFQILSSPEFKKHCRITETTVPHISPTDFKSFELIKPDNYLIEKFEKIAKLIHSQKAKMCNLSSEHKNLFDSLQNQAFSGKL